jgi:O-antigen ligase
MIRWQSSAAVALIALVPLLLPFSRSVELPILIGAVFGLYGCWTDRRRLLADPAAQTIALALGAYTLAALLSAIDAVEPQKSWQTALSSLRLLLYALGIRWLTLQSTPSAPAMVLAAALPIGLWALDATAQALTGYSLGGSLDADRLSGIFGADDLKLGPLLPALSPLLLWPLLTGALRVPSGVRIGALIGSYLLLAVVILLAGARAGWVSFALVTLLMLVQIARHDWRLAAVLSVAATAAVLTIGGVAYTQSETFRARVDRTLEFKDGDADTALAGRLPIWRTAIAMASAHPVNGVGVRSFRFAYPMHAAPGDPWVDPSGERGAAHAHQIVLELLTETGSIGLALWLTAAVLLWRARRRAHPGAAEALFVLCFPLNTHLAFYSAFMGIVLAWLIALYGLGEERIADER